MAAARVIAFPTRPDASRPLLVAAALLALLVVGLGAYVRLTDAGLGCPDWPGCYGHLVVPQEAADPGRACHEMIHRYAAGSLGLLIAALTFAAWRRPRPRADAWLATGLCGLVVLQALLGMLTVTELLRPAIVTGHLLGGMLVWATLVALWARNFGAPAPERRALGGLTLAAVLAQIALGGWVSSHYAGLACPDLPLCPGGWQPQTSLAAIQWTHRLGAVAVLAIAGTYAVALWRRPQRRAFGIAVAAALVMQLALGVANIVFHLPLPVAVAHNLGAAALLAAVAASLAGRRP
jgi:cytochrome c oxidase assembly protein subunit 15